MGGRSATSRCDPSGPPRFAASSRRRRVLAAYSPRRSPRRSPRCCRVVRGGVPVTADSSPRRPRDPSPRTIHVAAAGSPRLVSTIYPRRGRGGAATRLRGLSTSQARSPRASRQPADAPRRRHDPLRRGISRVRRTRVPARPRACAKPGASPAVGPVSLPSRQRRRSAAAAAASTDARVATSNSGERPVRRTLPIDVRNAASGLGGRRIVESVAMTVVRVASFVLGTRAARRTSAHCITTCVSKRHATD